MLHRFGLYQICYYSGRDQNYTLNYMHAKLILGNSNKAFAVNMPICVCVTVQTMGSNDLLSVYNKMQTFQYIIHAAWSCLRCCRFYCV